MDRRTLPSSPLIDEKATARLLGITPRALQAWRAYGGGPAFIRCGRAVRYSPDDLALWIDKRRHASTPGAAE